MKSQINLLQRQFVPKFEWVCANHFFGLTASAIVLCIVAYGLTGYFYQQKEAQVARLKNDIAQQQQRIEELTRDLTSRVTDPLLESKLRSFSEQTRTRGLLLNHIRTLSALKQRSFSVLFDSLAQSSSSELWLTHFLVTPDQLNIEGHIAAPRALPIWIGQLSKTDFFQGQEFNLASVQREDSGLTFQLTSVTTSSSDALAQVEVSDER